MLKLSILKFKEEIKMGEMPQDPMLLRSIVNTLLRDEYSSVKELCDDKDWSLDELTERLESAGFIYMPEINQYR